MSSKKVIRDDGSFVFIDKLRQKDTGKPTKIFKPKKGPGSYKREKAVTIP